MSTEVIIGIVLLLAVLGLAAGFLIPAYLRQRIPWRQLPGTPVRYHALTTVSEPLLRQVYNDAFVLLRRHTDFPSEVLARASSNLHVVVQRVEKWESPAHGGNVAGVATGTTIYVGSDLKAFLHEVAHACEYVEGVIDHDHRTWARRGIYVAENAFQTLLGTSS